MVPASCVVCQRERATVGVLCEPCAGELANAVAVAPQQLQPRTHGLANASLIDVWGHAHPLDPETPIGRSDLPDGIVIVQPSVSRVHAVLELVDGAWRLRDAGSSAGTFLNDKQVTAAMPRHGDRIRFGDVELYFVITAAPLPPRPEHIDTPTLRAPAKSTEPPASLPRGVAFVLQMPQGGGAGVAVIAGKQVALTTPQYELMALLAARMRAEAGKPDDERGFVPMAELLRLSLDVHDPGEDHIRQLVRRVRKALLKAEIGDLIEARRGVGYRLRVVPA